MVFLMLIVSVSVPVRPLRNDSFFNPGEGHGIKCLGDEPVEMIALILYE